MLRGPAAARTVSRRPAARALVPQRRHAGFVPKPVRWAVVGGVIVLFIGGYGRRLAQNRQVDPDELNSQYESALAALTLDQLRKEGVTLYRFLVCPFCGKVQAFLDRYKIPYTTVEVDPLTKSNLKDVGGYGKLPVLRIGSADASGPVVVDSMKIVDTLSPKVRATPADDDEKEWRRWAGEEFVRYLTLTQNTTPMDAYTHIEYAESTPWVSRMTTKLMGSVTMYLVVQKFVTAPKLKKLGWDGGDQQAALDAQAARWARDGLAGRSFHGGDAPDCADTDVYGVLHASRGLPAYAALLGRCDPAFRDWVHRMDRFIGREPGTDRTELSHLAAAA